MDALARLFTTITVAYRINPKIAFEVFIHKVDGLSEDQKIGERGLAGLFTFVGKLSRVELTPCRRFILNRHTTRYPPKNNGRAHRRRV